MKNTTSLYDMALSLRSEFERKTNSNGEHYQYQDSVFVSIDKNNETNVSETPDILNNEGVVQCLIIHRYKVKAVTNWYSWYTVEFIDVNGSVHTNELDDRYKLYVNYNGCFRNQRIHLAADGKSIYSCPWPNKSRIPIIWTLYNKCKSAKTTQEAQLLGELAIMDQSIISLTEDLANADYANELLAKERDQYKSLLDEIKELVHHKE
ncbi:MAG: hypothetical protein MJZ29_05240 [Bacteroidaceae bacterium]|nr:hypothetical protein [Bacteroidaceae bacterium]